MNPDPETERSADAAEAFNRLVQWIWQDGRRQKNGILIRAIVVCWVFERDLHPVKLTNLAAMFGMRKQSLGRWVDDFKRTFPGIRNPNMRRS